MNDFKNHQYWNVPDYIGEFNDYANGSDAWQFQPTDSGFLKVVSRGAPAEAWDAPTLVRATALASDLAVWRRSEPAMAARLTRRPQSQVRWTRKQPLPGRTEVLPRQTAYTYNSTIAMARARSHGDLSSSPN